MSRWLLFLSVALYAACLTQNSFCAAGNCSGWPGWSALLLGWLPVTDSLANLTWLANPLLVYGWIATFRSSKIQAVVLNLAALLTGASFMLARAAVNNEGGVPEPITGYGAGYWLWLASMAVACAAAFAISGSRSRSGAS